MLKKLVFLFALCSPCAAQSVGSVNGIPAQSIGNMGATATAGSGGVTVNTFVVPDTSAPTKFITAPSGACGSGVALSSVAAGSTFTLSDAIGTVQVFAEGAITAGHLIVGSTTTPGYAHDSGQTSSLNISQETPVCGTALNSVSSGALVTINPRSRGSFGHKVDQVNVPVTIATCGSSYALAFASNGDAMIDLTLTGACTLTLTAPTATSPATFQRLTLFIHPATYQATLPASSSALAWRGGTAPTPSTSNLTVITFGSTGTAPVAGDI